ncbi:DNA cytosine methyltransferase [Pedobacter agri]|uniref:DNA cytosine methyltransferase n=1 Tax=Pedobacter agri TaxID=454586 RepID=UPI00292CCF0D|nr:DNA cytosine methyltransferase [Pedobacter agri]
MSEEQRAYTVNNQLDTILVSKVNAIGFFSGAGGLDIGTQLAGVKIISSLDFDRDSVKTMQANDYFKHAQHIHQDIRQVSAKDYTSILKENNPEKLILVGGPPCQPFSKGGYWVTHDKRKANDDPRNMIGNYLRMIDDLRPDGFLLENVESILHPTNKIAVDNLEQAIGELGYGLKTVNTNAIDYGVPQKRKRVFFIASKKGFKGMPQKTHGSTKEIAENPNLKPYDTTSQWIAKYDIPALFEPEEDTLGKTYSQELMAIPPGKNYMALTARDHYPDPPFVAGTRFWNFLLKLHPDLPSWTISAQPGPWVGPFHWSGRRLRVPEIAAIQTFPEDYKFVGNRRSIQKQIGNAVPSLLGKAMIEYLKANI